MPEKKGPPKPATTPNRRPPGRGPATVAKAPATKPPSSKPVPVTAPKAAVRMTPLERRARSLIKVFRRRGPDGKLLYSKADRRRVYQLLLVTVVSPSQYESLSPRLQAMLGELAKSSGAERAKSGKEAMKSLQAYFQKNPPNPQLLADLNDALRVLMKDLEKAAPLGSKDDGRKRSPLEAPVAPKPVVRTRSEEDEDEEPKGPGIEEVLLPKHLHEKKDALMETLRQVRRFK